MKKNMMAIKKNLTVAQLIIISLTGTIFAQQEKQQEYVQVVNVELILRVLQDGSLVGGLEKKDFALYEDGEKCEINGFFENRRRMARTPAAAAQLQLPRLYLLFFWVGNPAADVEGVLNKFFSDIYREGDRVILSTPLKTFDLSSRQDGEWTLSAFLEQWRLEARAGRLKKIQAHEQLNRMCEDLISRLAADIRQGQRINAFIKQYQGAVLEYQLRELTPDLTNFQAMADSLIPIKNDKFALVFFQHDVLPLLDIVQFRSQCAANGITEEVVNSLVAELDTVEIQSKMFFNTQSFSEKLKTLFIQANTQFHLLFLSPDRNDMRANVSSAVPFTKSEEVYSNWDRVLREISKNTGGLILEGDRMVSALEQVIAFEDVYYHLTYVPRQQGKKKRKIDIRVDRPNMRVLHGRSLELKELPLVKISDISASSGLIRLTVADFYPVSKDGVPTGLVRVEVTGGQEGTGPPRLLCAQTSETVGLLEVPFDFPQMGRWNLEVQVVDQITGQRDVKKTAIEIAPAISAGALAQVPDSILQPILLKAAAYAERLKKTTLEFLCREEVTEEVYAVEPGSLTRSFSRNHWKYDQRVSGRDGKIVENRVLLEKNFQKIQRINARLETVFRSSCSLYLPVNLLASENQPLYHYRFLDQENQVWHIAATRRDPSLHIPWGEIWVSGVDGSVLTIHVQQPLPSGFETRAEKISKKGLLPAFTTTHEFNLEMKGIRFPSQTIFVESYEADAKSTEHSRTYFEYSSYRFFPEATGATEKNE